MLQALEINYGRRANKRSYEHYIYKKPNNNNYNYNYNYNYNNNSNDYPKIIPNRRLNPINTKQIKNIGIKL